MDLTTIFSGGCALITLLLAYVALSRDARARFWSILLGAVQIGIMAYAIYWVASFVMRDGSPSRLEVFNFALWAFNFSMSANSFVTRIAIAFRANTIR